MRMKILCVAALAAILTASEATSVIAAEKKAETLSVEAIYAKKADLNKKTVTVKGKVVKVNLGIMDRNWVHIQDGTGKPGTNDITVTTGKDPGVAVGDTATATGTLATGRDFGGGYSYAVIIEDATIKKSK